MLEVGPIEFKFVVKSGEELVRWESGGNHVLDAAQLNEIVSKAGAADLVIDKSSFCTLSPNIHLKLEAEVRLDTEGYVLT